ncbi:MAG: hypothetical protein ACREFE_10225 [Limisphaerales bacterium]
MFLFDDKPDYLEDASSFQMLIEKWKPRGCKTEKDFELSLYKFLHKALEDVQITKQYARGRIRADLVVAGKFIIELKINLDTTSKYQRLIGQLAAYESWEGLVIILLTGITDKNLFKELKTHIEKNNEVIAGSLATFFGADAKFLLIEK